MQTWIMVLFGAAHTVLGLAVFGFVAWLMLGGEEDEAGGTDDGGGGGGLRPRPWRPGPGRPRQRRGPLRMPDVSRRRGPAVRIARQPR
ncbi:MAG: hypothetical protein ACKO7U_03680 [Actinomycetota bacterium]